jgi:hypothetical protein
MPDPNAPECDCGTLENLSKEPETPIGYDAELNEYYIRGRNGRGRILIYHCLFCGGRTPKSRRAALFAHVTQAERTRIWGIVQNLQTLPAVLATLGPLDLDQPIGGSTTLPGEGGRTDFCRTLTYEGLSTTVDLKVSVHPDGTIGFMYWPKPLEKTGSGEPAG